MGAVRIIAALLVFCLAACDAPVDAPGEHAAGSNTRYAITLTGEDSARLGLETQPAAMATYTPHVHGYGVIVNFATVAQAVANVLMAQAAQRQSHAALLDARALFGKPHSSHALSREALDSAEHQAAGDDAQLDLALRQEGAAFGQHAPWRGSERDSAVLANLSSGRAVLVEATFPLGVELGVRPSQLLITHLNESADAPAASATLIWDAPADPSIPGRSFFAVVETADLAQGEHVTVVAPTGAPLSGVAVPSDAVVLSEDKVWCYVASGPNSFARLPVDVNLALGNGYFVPSGIAPNQPVVIKGAGLLLARELGLATPGQD